MRRALAFLVASLASACTHSHLARNAPGIVEIDKRPASEADRVPTDPGEQMITLSYGGFAGVGVADGTGPLRSTYGVGPELSVAYGTRRTSHNADDWFFTFEQGVGVNLGLTALTREGQGIGPAYGEVAVRAGMVASLAAGWAWDINDETHGPQLTFVVAELFARATHQLGTSTTVTLGLMLKGEHGWIWSR